jgi:diguanylate cyclase (GGDEF)-like protein/PAS domain S-box-containing protein
MPVTTRLILDKVMDLLLDTVCVVDAEGRFVFLSASCENLLGYTQEELLGRKMIELVLPEDRERTLEAAARVMSGRSHMHFENRYVRKDGRIVDIMWSARWSETDRLRFAVARDITDLKHAERKQRGLYEISEAAHDAENMDALYRHINRIIGGLLPSDLFFTARYDEKSNTLSFPHISGELPRQLEPHRLDSGSSLARVIHSGQTLLLSNTSVVAGQFPELPGTGGYRQWLGVPLISPEGVVGALVMARRAAGTPYTDKDRELLQFVSTQVAITIERKQAETRLQHSASHDPLTDLPNRMLFHDRFEMALKTARREREKVALLYLDMDEFKEVNDRYGHQAGDRLLCELSRRLSGCVRESDTVARMGGDEFSVLITNIQGARSVDTVMEKIQAAIRLPYELGEYNLQISASIGAAIYPDHGQTQEQLIRHADERMYHAKRNQITAQ